jgi:hypothetical protein
LVTVAGAPLSVTVMVVVAAALLAGLLAVRTTVNVPV